MDLDSVVERLADLLERPLVVYDGDMNVAAYSVHGVDADEARQRSILSRQATPRAREMLRAHVAASSAAPVRLPVEAGFPERIAVAVRHDGHMMGYLVWVEPGAPLEVSGPVRDLVERYGPELGRLLAVRALDSQEGRLRLRVLLSDLVSDDARRRAEAARALLTDGTLPSVPQYTGVVLVVPDASGASAARRRSELEAALGNVARWTRETVVGAVIGGEAIAVLAHGTGRPELSGVPANRSAQLVGVGGAVPELADVVSSVRQARIAARGGLLDPGRYGRVTWWDDLGLDRLLLQLPLDQLTMEDLPSPAARLLDATSGPDLTSTLEVYLDCSGDGQETARRLTIHRSTLYYRLDRIHMITGVDLHDGEVRRELHTALRVARLAGLTPIPGERQSAKQRPAADGSV